MKIKDICQFVYDKYNWKGSAVEEFSLPYIYQYCDKFYVAFFLYELNENVEWPQIEIVNVSKVILVDYNTGEMKELTDLSEFELKPPYTIDYTEFSRSKNDDLDIIVDKYYNIMDDYFNGKVVINDYLDIISDLMPSDFKKVYMALNAKFFVFSDNIKKS